MSTSTSYKRPEREPDLVWPPEGGCDEVKLWVDENLISINGEARRPYTFSVIKLLERSAKGNLSKYRRQSSLDFLLERELFDL